MLRELVGRLVLLFFATLLALSLFQMLTSLLTVS
jgi:hypothetical protein